MRWSGWRHPLPAALRLAAREEPELALVDVFLGSNPDGIKVAAELAERGVLVLFLTGSAEHIPDDLAGAVGVIKKPFIPEELTQAVEFVKYAAPNTAAFAAPGACAHARHRRAICRRACIGLTRAPA